MKNEVFYHNKLLYRHQAKNLWPILLLCVTTIKFIVSQAWTSPFSNRCLAGERNLPCWIENKCIWAIFLHLLAPTLRTLCLSLFSDWQPPLFSITDSLYTRNIISWFMHDVLGSLELQKTGSIKHLHHFLHYSPSLTRLLHHCHSPTLSMLLIFTFTWSHQ